MKDFLTKPLTFVIVVIMTIIGVRLFDTSTAQAAKLSGANQALVDQYVAQSAPPAVNCDVASNNCLAASFTTTGASTADHFTATVSGVANAFVDANNDAKVALGSAGAGISGDATGAYIPNLGSSVGSLRPASSGSLGTSGTGWGALFLSAANGTNLISLTDSTNAKTLKIRNNNDALQFLSNSNGTPTIINGGGNPWVALNAGATAGARINGDDGNGSTSVGVSLSNETTLTTAGALIAEFKNGRSGSRVAYVDKDGTFQSSAMVGTAASGTGITANYSGALRSWVHKVTVINTALAAAATSDVTLAVTPVNSRVIRVTADVTQVFTGGALSAMTVTCGKTAGGNEYLLSNSVFAAQNTWGDVAAEVGAGLLTATWADFGTSAAGVPGAITVQCRFTCTGANCNAATQGSVAFYVEGVTY